jgi:hypothetical protein
LAAVCSSGQNLQRGKGGGVRRAKRSLTTTPNQRASTQSLLARDSSTIRTSATPNKP